jgi:hypothetical protein
MYKVKGDSSSLMPGKLPPQVIDFQIIESDESITCGGNLPGMREEESPLTLYIVI